VGKGSGQPTDPQHTSTPTQHSNKEPITVLIIISTQKDPPIHLVANETVYKEWEDRMERAATTASSLEAECQDTILGGAKAQSRFEAASKQSNDPPLSRVNTLGSGEDGMKLMELM
ncbi:hypothetical protein Tco_1469043, partial [Tanacetum coccineum]